MHDPGQNHSAQAAMTAAVYAAQTPAMAKIAILSTKRISPCYAAVLKLRKLADAFVTMRRADRPPHLHRRNGR
jgi:hypothetical protein